MNDVTLEKVYALNDELASLAAAGVPINLGTDGGPTDQSLARINASLALRTSLGQDVATALEEDRELPPTYQNSVLAGLEANQLSLALESISRQPTAWDDLRKTAAHALVQPLIVLGIAYFGLIAMCVTFEPTVASLYQDMREQPNVGARLLAVVHQWMPIWIPGVPLLLAAAIYFWRRRASQAPPPLPGAQRYFATVSYALFSEQLATLLDAGVSLPEALRLAGNSTGNFSLSAASDTLASHTAEEPYNPEELRQLDSFPPLLRWALTGDLGGEPLPQILQFAANTYRKKAERQAAIWHATLPTLMGAFLGGLIVLGYALAAFGTYVGLLRDLS